MNSADLVHWMRQRLLERIPDLLVSGAAGFQAASENNPLSTPAVYVFSVHEAAETSTIDFPLSQRVKFALAVVIVVRNVADSLGDAACESLDAVRADIWSALHGAQIDADHEPLTFDSGSVLALRDRHLWWQDLWSSARHVAAAL